MRLCNFSLVPRFDDAEKRNVIEVQGTVTLTDEGIELAKAILSWGIVAAQKPTAGIKTELEGMLSELANVGDDRQPSGKPGLFSAGGDVGANLGELIAFSEYATNAKQHKFETIKLCDQLIEGGAMGHGRHIVDAATRLRSDIYESLTEEQRQEHAESASPKNIDPAPGGEVNAPIDDHSGAQPNGEQAQPTAENGTSKKTAPRCPTVG